MPKTAGVGIGASDKRDRPALQLLSSLNDAVEVHVVVDQADVPHDRTLQVGDVGRLRWLAVESLEVDAVRYQDGRRTRPTKVVGEGVRSGNADIAVTSKIFDARSQVSGIHVRKRVVAVLI